MRPIIKPDPPQLDTLSFAEFARVLGNAVGRFCSFCEKALTYRLLLFHKQRGLLTTDSQISTTDWPDLLLICGDCAASVTTFTPHAVYFWPDTSAAQQAPYVYNRVDNIAVTALDPDGTVIAQGATSLVLVQISTDISQELQVAARNTYALFRLNGRFFNESVQQPAYTLPYAEYVHPSDARLDQRWDVYLRAVEAAQGLARAIPTIPLGPAYVQTMLAMINLSVQGFGFHSTWLATISATLNAMDSSLLPKLLGLMTGQPAPQPPLDRKRVYIQMEDGVQQAPAEVDRKRARLEQTLARLIATQA